ncbi:MAG: glycosyltransferase family 4 protein [Anaerolineaceae bacterium]
MNLLFVADGRSPTARSWIINIQKDGHRVTFITTYPCQELPGLAGFHTLPVAFSRFTSRGGSPNIPHTKYNLTRQLINALRPNLLNLRYTLGPLTLPFYQNKFLKIVDRIGPDLIHALRIPFEGMLAKSAPARYPLVISIWGNDLTLHANGSYNMGKVTHNTLSRADGLMADTNRDIRLAKNWGFRNQLPSLVVPGCGGLDIEEINTARSLSPKRLLELIPSSNHLVINPRGLRPGSLRTDIFFKAARIVSAKHPDVCFLCPTMAGQSEALRYIARYKLERNVILLPSLTQPELWWLFAQSEMIISPGVHDGVPNSLLEALASGCYPIAGDIESIREWITPGVNGLLYPPTDASALAESISLILENPDRRYDAARYNLNLIRERADQSIIRKKISDFYQNMAG